ncbi:MAG: InlB B-repeat-containing protein, partial [Clostridiales bacterium]|nr:InlB B-repeat-containing protein [Clostridiales bacterium]
VTVTITGAGNYKGTAKGTFTIYREFTVTFMSNGQEYDSAQVREGRKATPPTSPADMIEYRFGGWYTVDNKKYTFNETVTGDITLYAKWIRVRYVEFDTGDPNVTISKQRVDDGTYATRPADPVRPGYRFDGWYNNGSLYGFNTKVYDDITLEARWTPVYTITFVTGDGSAIEPQYIPEDELATLPADPPTWDGHTFAGWYSDEDCTIPYDFAEPVKSSFPLYAKWDVDPNSG